jgi:hypothetical protein
MFLVGGPAAAGIRRQHLMRQFLDIVHRRLDGRAVAVFSMTRRSIAFPPCSIVDPENSGSPNRGFLHWQP